MLFAECLAGARVRTGRRVVDSRDPGDHVNIGDHDERAWSYWYQVRSNLSHRGKGAARDADIVREALIDVHDVLRLLLRRELPGIERAWIEADPEGARHGRLLRPIDDEPRASERKSGRGAPPRATVA
jgi:hypothetical protein